MIKVKLLIILLTACIDLPLKSLGSVGGLMAFISGDQMMCDLFNKKREAKYKEILAKAQQIRQDLSYSDQQQSKIQEILLDCCWFGFIDIIKTFLKRGVDLDFACYSKNAKEKQCPLGIAIISYNFVKNIDLIKLLLKYKAHISLGDLSLAVQLSHYDIVKVLLEHGANVNEISPDGYSPLIYAINIDSDNNEKFKIISILLSYGADNLIKTKNSINKNQDAYSFIKDSYYHKDKKEILNFISNFNITQEKISNKLYNKDNNQDLEIIIDPELFRIIFFRYLFLGDFKALTYLTNNYKEEVEKLSKFLKLVARFINQVYSGEFNSNAINYILFDNQLYNQILEYKVYHIAKYKNLKKLKFFIYKFCILRRLSNFKQIPNECIALICSEL